MLDFFLMAAAAIGILIVFSMVGSIMYRCALQLFPYLRARMGAFREFAERSGGRFRRFGLHGSPRAEIDRADGMLTIQFELRRRTSHIDLRVIGHGASIAGSHKKSLGTAKPGSPGAALERAAEDLGHVPEKTKLWNSNVLDPAIPRIWITPDEAGVSLRGWIPPGRFEESVLETEQRLRALAQEIAEIEAAQPRPIAPQE